MTEITASGYTIKGKRYARVTAILAHCGLTDFGKIPAHMREWVMERGKQNHLAWQYIEEGKGAQYDFDPEVQKYLPAHARFLRDTGFKALPDGIEKQVHSDSLRVAGTLDRIGMMQGKLVLMDYKKHLRQ